MKFDTNQYITKVIRPSEGKKGLALKTLVQRGDEDKMLKCLLMMDDP